MIIGKTSQEVLLDILPKQQVATPSVTKKAAHQKLDLF